LIAGYCIPFPPIDNCLPPKFSWRGWKAFI